MFWLTLGIIISAIGGLILVRYIAAHKHSPHLVCPAGNDCQKAVQGKYSKFLGIPLENLGTLYYALIILIYIGALAGTAPGWMLTGGLLLAGIGLAFSMYLSIVQIFGVKSWCTLCLGSMGISLLIFALAFLGFESSLAEFAYNYRDLLKWLYMLGVIVGSVFTTMHAYIFVSFLKDFEISRKEERRLEMFSHSAWVALGLSFLSGLGILLTDYNVEYSQANQTIVMIIIVGMLIVYEVVVNMVISPRLIGMHFGDHPELDDHEHAIQRKVSFAFIAVGVVSWYSLLLLSVFDWFSFSSGQILIGYVILLVLGVLVTSLVEVVLYRKSLHTLDPELLNQENENQD
ncbi:MAG: hypothetical protein MRY57_02930 [Candidatus Pacebacteria bacterium]|nr:hypothetical protein [Candidatus Paceibacterota bacterium]